MATVVCRCGRCVPASGSAQIDLQTSSRDGFHPSLSLGVALCASGDGKGEGWPGDTHPHWHYGCPHETGMDEWALELGRLWAALQPHV